MAPKQENQRHRLTLTQLASYDDVLTALLVDSVYYWTTIRKNKESKHGKARIPEDVPKILRDQLIANHDPAKTEELLLQLPTMRRELDRLKGKKEREDFQRHMRKYINVWSTDCPFEIATTNRYQIKEYEGAVFARKAVEKGETIKYLCGNLVAMSAEEEQDLDLKRRDFSIVMSSRKKTPSLFLGPARFANHDCNANAGLITTGSDGMRVVALRKIQVNDEITVSYGADYFGEANCECLCRTCELADRNGWTSSLQFHEAQVYHKKPKKEAGGGRPAKRQRIAPPNPAQDSVKVENGESGARGGEDDEATPLVRQRSRVQGHNPSPLVPALLAPAGSESSLADSAQPRRHSVDRLPFPLPEPDRRRHSFNGIIPAIIPTDAEGPGRPIDGPPTLDGNELEDVFLVPCSPWDPLHDPVQEHAKPSSGDSQLHVPTEADPKQVRKLSMQVSAPTSAAESVFDEDSHKRSSTPVSPSNTPRSDEIITKDPLERSEADQQDQPTNAPSPQIKLSNESDAEAAPARSKEERRASFCISELSDISSNEYFDERRHLLVPKPRTRSSRPLAGIAAQSRRSVSTPRTGPITADEFASRTPMEGQPRRPGDYVRTPQLLLNTYCRWRDCRTCSGVFLQDEDRRTKRECPRCERHSMLYGFTWPKMEKGQRSWALGQPCGSSGSSGSGAGSKRKRSANAAEDDSEERVMDHRTVWRFVHSLEEKAESAKGKGLLPPSDEILAELAATRKLAEEEEERVALEWAHAPKRKIYGYGKNDDDEPPRKRARGSSKKGGRPRASVASKIRKAGGFRRAGSKVKMRVGKPGKAVSAKPIKVLSATDERELVNERKRGKKPRVPQPRVVRVPGKGGWKGWVALEDDANGPETMEEQMARVAAEGVGGTRRGTRLGRM